MILQSFPVLILRILHVIETVFSHFFLVGLRLASSIPIMEILLDRYVRDVKGILNLN